MNKEILNDDQILDMMECFSKGEGHCLSCKMRVHCNQIENYSLALVKRLKLKQLPEKAITLTEQEREQLKAFCLGEWVETALVEKALNIDFGQGLKMFDFSREATWNPAPLNGQSIVTKFKLKK